MKGAFSVDVATSGIEVGAGGDTDNHGVHGGSSAPESVETGLRPGELSTGDRDTVAVRVRHATPGPATELCEGGARSRPPVLAEKSHVPPSPPSACQAHVSCGPAPRLPDLREPSV